MVWSLSNGGGREARKDGGAAGRGNCGTSGKLWELRVPRVLLPQSGNMSRPRLGQWSGVICGRRPVSGTGKSSPNVTRRHGDGRHRGWRSPWAAGRETPPAACFSRGGSDLGVPWACLVASRPARFRAVRV